MVRLVRFGASQTPAYAIRFGRNERSVRQKEGSYTMHKPNLNRQPRPTLGNERSVRRGGPNRLGGVRFGRLGSSGRHLRTCSGTAGMPRYAEQVRFGCISGRVFGAQFGVL